VWPYRVRLTQYAGVVLRAPSLPGWENLHLRQILSEAFQTPVYVGNDANVAALGEWVYGAGQGHQDLIYLTISTGIGGGVIANGQMLLGANGLAGRAGACHRSSRRANLQLRAARASGSACFRVQVSPDG
jgi:predicted NBD/HSP70 family sugar kinase